MLLLDAIVSRAMQVPQCYDFAQQVIAGPMHNMIADIIRAEIPDKPGIQILDVGCVLVRIAKLFKRHYTGLDLDRRYISHASRRIRNRMQFRSAMLSA